MIATGWSKTWSRCTFNELKRKYILLLLQNKRLGPMGRNWYRCNMCSASRLQIWTVRTTFLHMNMVHLTNLTQILSQLLLLVIFCLLKDKGAIGELKSFLRFIGPDSDGRCLIYNGTVSSKAGMINLNLY